MGEIYSTHWEDETCIQTFSRETSFTRADSETDSLQSGTIPLREQHYE
jgi:hypothetical protein